MLSENEEPIYNKDGVKIGVFIDINKYREIEEKLRKYKNLEKLISELEEQYFGEEALKRLKDFEEGKTKALSLKEFAELLGLADEIQD